MGYVEKARWLASGFTHESKNLELGCNVLKKSPQDDCSPGVEKMLVSRGSNAPRRRAVSTDP